jgi:GNAT superfamily N-acetyltransferase
VAATVRLARATDAQQVAAVHVASWQWAYAGLLPAEELAGLSVAYLDRQVAGTGLGRRLHEAGVGWLAEQGWTRALLWVLRDNARARRFYELCGWRADGVTKTVPRPDLVDLDEVRYERPLVPATGAMARGTLPS